MKTCKKCKEIKDETEFYVNNSLKDKLTIYCKLCMISAEKDYDSRNPMKKIIRKNVRL